MGHRLTSKPVPDDMNGICNAIAALDKSLNTGASPVFAGVGLTGLTENALMYADSSGVLTSLAAATNGQLIIGSTGAAPSVAALTGTASQITVLNEAGSITLSLDAAITGHLHDGHTLQHDAVNSDGGAFSFTTTGLVTFNQSIASANYAADNKLTACATNAGALDFSAASLTLIVAGSATINAGTHLDHALTKDADLAVWLRGDDETGGEPEDLGASENAWSYGGSAAQTDLGVIGKGFLFATATSDIITGDSPTGLPLGTTNRTVAFWMRDDVGTGGLYMFNQGGIGTGTRWTMQTVAATGLLFLGVGAGNKTGTSVVLKDGAWHHVAMVLDGTAVSDVTFYIDGEVDAQSGLSERTLATDQAFVDIGGVRGIPAMNGAIDDVRVYGRNLSAAEIKQLYELGTLDAMTTFSAAYFTEYVAGRSGYFNNLNVSGTLTYNHINRAITDLVVTNSTDFNKVGLTNTGDLLSGTTATYSIGSNVDTYKYGYIKHIYVADDGTIGVGTGGAPTLTFDATGSSLNLSAHNFTVDTNVFKVDATSDIVSVNGITKLGDGGTTNYTQVSATGAITQHGSAAASFNATTVTTLTSQVDALNTAAMFYGIYNSHTKTAGASDVSDHMYSLYNVFTLNQVGGEVGYVFGFENQINQTLGDVGSVGDPRSLYGIRSILDLDAGTIHADTYNEWFSTDQEVAHTISGNGYGIYMKLVYDGTVTGSTYGLFIDDLSRGLDFGIYVKEAVANYFAGTVGIGVADPHSKLEVNGAISSATATIHPTGQTDDTDVSGVNVLFIDADGANNALISGFTGGVDGQVLYVSIIDHTKDVTMQHIEGVSVQDLYMHDSSDETLDNFGGWTFVCDGTNWYDISHAKHV